MNEAQLHFFIVAALLVLSGVILFFSFFVTAPYGRYARPWWSGPDLPSRAAWMIMELPQPAGFLLCFILGDRRTSPAAIAFLGMWIFHYTYRMFIYPFIPRSSSMSLSVVAMGFALNTAMSYANGRWLFTLGPARVLSWLHDPRFIAGALLFFGGWLLCTASDAMLRRLRGPGDRSRKIPRGGPFRWVTSPNYLGEIVMWGGWAAATWSASGLSILLITAANLVPRAIRNHRYMKKKFPDYPEERKALVPYVL